jgi:hypothetical protein
MIGHLIAILGIHTLGDFFLQTRSMATKKSTSLLWLTLHVLVYTMTFMVFGMIFGNHLVVGEENVMPVVLEFCLLNGVIHWGTDFLTSKGTTYFYGKENNYLFFGTIGIDQFIHISTLLLTYSYFFT